MKGDPFSGLKDPLLNFLKGSAAVRLLEGVRCGKRTRKVLEEVDGCGTWPAEFDKESSLNESLKTIAYLVMIDTRFSLHGLYGSPAALLRTMAMTEDTGIHSPDKMVRELIHKNVRELHESR